MLNQESTDSEQPLSIFVLEDDENLRAILCETLEDEGWNVDSASGGREAVAKVTGRHFDLLIVDVRMEGMTGLDAFSLMKQQGLDIPCLVITGYATEEDSIRAIRLGVGDYLRKPFEMRSFLLCVRRLTAQGARQKEQVQREQALERILHEAIAAVCLEQPGCLAAIQKSHQIARNLGLDSPTCFRIQLALAMFALKREQQIVQPDLQQIVKYVPERWDGQGPLGIKGEEIPLASRIVRLCQASQSHSTAEIRQQQQGEIDPYLLEYLDLDEQEDQAKRMLGWARTLLDSGNETAAAQALLDAGSPTGLSLLNWHLLKLRMLPNSEKRQKALEILEWSRTQPFAFQAKLDLSLSLIKLEPTLAAEWLKETLQQVNSEQLAANLVHRQALKAQIQLALWTLGQQDFPGESALRCLLEPLHQAILVSSLGWLWLPLMELRQRAGQPLTESEAMMLLLRRFGSSLLGQMGNASSEMKAWLLTNLATQNWSRQIVQFLTQDPDRQVAAAAQNVASKSTATGQENAKTPLLRMQSFGAFEVSVGGEAVAEKAWRGTRNKYLLAYFAAANKMVTEDRIVDLFWDEDQEKGKRGLYNSLSHLRKILKPEGWQGDLDFLQRNRDQVGLNQEADRWSDVEEFSRNLQAAAKARQAGDQEAARLALRQALAVYSGPYLENCYMDWALTLRTRFEQEAGDACILSAQLEIEAEQYQCAIEQALKALQIDNCNQKAALMAMRAYTLAKRPEEAIRLYELTQKRLKQELEIEPSLELFEAFQRARLAA
jgi:DNA-binding SARP family transcriptional activator/FixJ family two-component response regulator